MHALVAERRQRSEESRTLFNVLIVTGGSIRRGKVELLSGAVKLNRSVIKDLGAWTGRAHAKETADCGAQWAVPGS